MQPLTAITTSAKDAPTALVRRPDGRQFYLHSRVNPREEAAFLVADLPRQERTLYVVVGFGLGYHVEALLDHIPQSAHVAVVEPADLRLSVEAARVRRGRGLEWMRSDRLHLLAHHDPALAAIHLADRLTSRHLLSVTLVPHQPSMQTSPAYYEALIGQLPQALPAAIQQQLNVLDKMLEGDLRNFWANLSSSWNEAPTRVLRGLWQGKPLVIVSGGPSLTGQLRDLAVLKDRTLILATGSTARTLIADGVTPDLVVSVDPYDLNLAHFVGWDGADIPLVYYHRIHCGIPRVYTGPMCAFRMHDEPPLPLMPDDGRPAFSRGGTVAFSALQLAHLLGANPIVFVGQDFAFAGGRTHADGAIYNESFDGTTPPSDYVHVAGVDGGPVVTSRLMQMYLLHMQDYLLQVETRRPKIMHINTSSTGAMIQGTICRPLVDVLAHFASLSEPARHEIRQALAHHQSPPIAEQAALIADWVTMLAAMPLDDEQVTPEALLDRFAETPMYSVVGRGYSDLRYVYDTKYRRGEHPASALFASRLRHHFRQVLDDLRRESAAL